MYYAKWDKEIEGLVTRNPEIFFVVTVRLFKRTPL